MSQTIINFRKQFCNYDPRFKNSIIRILNALVQLLENTIKTICVQNEKRTQLIRKLIILLRAAENARDN